MQPLDSPSSTSRAIFEQAGRIIPDALRTGATSDPALVESLARQMAAVRVDLPLQLKLLLDAVRFFYVSGQPIRGLPIAVAARKLALEIAAADDLLDALLLIGVCAADTGSLPTAMEAYADALLLAQNRSDQVREGKIWLNLGVALVYSGLYREALSCYERAQALAQTHPELSALLSVVLTNIALCHLNLDEISLGLRAIAAAVDTAPPVSNAHTALNRVLLENYFTRLLLETNDIPGAKVHSQLARQYASMSKTPRADISASVAEGLSDVFSGQTDIGISRLIGTLERARTLKVASREVLVALTKAFEHIGQPDRALVYLRQMLDQQRKSQEQNVLRHVKLHLEKVHPNVEDETSVLRKLTTKEELLEGRIAKRELDRQSKELFVARVEVMERLAVAAELRDDSTGEHSYRVGRLASLLAKEYGCDDDTIFMIDIAARLHDIGKIGIPDGILLKDSALNAAEREVMKTHTNIGAEVLAKSEIPQMKMAEEIARHHHEWWDGSGYPDSQSGSGITLGARITALADVFDALTHKRPYKEAWTVESALTEILSLRGRQFDPELTDIFLALVTRLQREHLNLDDFLGEAARKSPFIQARRKIEKIRDKGSDERRGTSTSRIDLQR
ncbi:MAG: HD domain-containing protein [Betaproteobacteria bacterium]|nr:HD domain-containing protein [Betaproteobacteria bacterium]